MKKTLLIFTFLCLSIASLFATPPVPTRNQIANDLVGQKLTEGYKNGWFDNGWVWQIEKGEIKALNIEKVVSNTATDYCVIARVRLQSEVNAFNAKLKINYRLTNNRWRFEYVLSQGMDIVKTGKYNDCLSLEVGPCGIFGTALHIKNDCGVRLYCAGYIKTKEGEWQKFFRTVASHGNAGVGGSYSLDPDVTDYKIAFIERCD